MPKSGFIEKQNRNYGKILIVGMQLGEQKTADYVMIALHRAGWGYKRIHSLFEEVSEIAEYYEKAFHRGMEQDIYQERMDAEIKSFVEGNQEFFPFAERYPYFENTGYDRMPKEKKKKYH